MHWRKGRTPHILGYSAFTPQAQLPYSEEARASLSYTCEFSTYHSPNFTQGNKAYLASLQANIVSSWPPSLVLFPLDHAVSFFSPTNLFLSLNPFDEFLPPNLKLESLPARRENLSKPVFGIHADYFCSALPTANTKLSPLVKRTLFWPTAFDSSA